MVTSNTYSFPNVTAHNLIRDAFEQLGVNPSLISGQQYNLAIQSLNMVLNSWISKKGVNLFTVEQQMIALNAGQNVYQLPANTSRILECVAINATPWSFPTGTTYFNSTVMPNAGPVTDCLVFTNTNSNYDEPLQSVMLDLAVSGPVYVAQLGTIATNYPLIQYVGIQAGWQDLWTFAVDYNLQTNPSVTTPTTKILDPNWQTLLQLPTLNYYAGVMQYFALPYQIQQPSYLRIREANNQAIALQTITFFTQQNMIPMAPIDRNTYTKMAQNPNIQGNSSCYYVDRTSQPTISLYPIPDGNNYNFIVYNRTRMIQDVTSGTQSLDISPRFIEAATAALAARLARLYAAEKIELLTNISDALFMQVAGEDVQHLPIKFEMQKR